MVNNDISIETLKNNGIIPKHDNGLAPVGTAGEDRSQDNNPEREALSIFDSANISDTAQKSKLTAEEMAKNQTISDSRNALLSFSYISVYDEKTHQYKLVPNYDTAPKDLKSIKSWEESANKALHAAKRLKTDNKEVEEIRFLAERQKTVAEAFRAYYKGNYKKAARLFEKIPEKTRNVEILQAMNTCYSRIGNKLLADKTFDALQKAVATREKVARDPTWRIIPEVPIEPIAQDRGEIRLAEKAIIKNPAIEAKAKLIAATKNNKILEDEEVLRDIILSEIKGASEELATQRKELTAGKSEDPDIPRISIENLQARITTDVKIIADYYKKTADTLIYADVYYLAAQNIKDPQLASVFLQKHYEIKTPYVARLVEFRLITTNEGKQKCPQGSLLPTIGNREEAEAIIEDAASVLELTSTLSEDNPDIYFYRTVAKAHIKLAEIYKKLDSGDTNGTLIDLFAMLEEHKNDPAIYQAISQCYQAEKTESGKVLADYYKNKAQGKNTEESVKLLRQKPTINDFSTAYSSLFGYETTPKTGYIYALPEISNLQTAYAIRSNAIEVGDIALAVPETSGNGIDFALVNRLYAEGNIAYYKGDYAAAINSFNDTLAVFESSYLPPPTNYSIYRDMADCYEKTGDTANALVAYAKAEKLSENYTAEADCRQKIESLTERIINSENLSVLIENRMFYTREGTPKYILDDSTLPYPRTTKEINEFIEDLSYALALIKTLPAGNQLYAYAKPIEKQIEFLNICQTFYLGDGESAKIKLFALLSEKKDPAIYKMLAQYYHQSNDPYGEVIAAYYNEKAEDFGNISSLTGPAEVDPDKMLIALRSLIGFAPEIAGFTLPSIANELEAKAMQANAGEVLEMLGYSSEDLSNMLNVVQLNLYYSTGWINLHNGSYREAEKSFQNITKDTMLSLILTSNHWQTIAACYEKAGNKEEALAAYKKAEEMAQDNETMVAMQTEIDRLSKQGVRYPQIVDAKKSVAPPNDKESLPQTAKKP